MQEDEQDWGIEPSEASLPPLQEEEKERTEADSTSSSSKRQKLKTPRYARAKECRPRHIKFLDIYKNAPRRAITATNRFSQSRVLMPCTDATSWERLLDQCGKYLALSRPARRLFTTNGTELRTYEEVQDRMELYVSEGEEFRGRVIMSAHQKREEMKKAQLKELLAQKPDKPSDDNEGDHDGFAISKKKKQPAPAQVVPDVTEDNSLEDASVKESPRLEVAHEVSPVAVSEPSMEDIPAETQGGIQTVIFRTSGLTMTQFDDDM